VALVTGTGAGGGNRKKKPQHSSSRTGRVTSTVRFQQIAAKSQAKTNLSVGDLKYLQRLAWTTKTDSTEATLKQAIDIARRWIDGLKNHGTQQMTDAQGKKVNVEAFGLEYKAFHDTGTIKNNAAYQGVIDSFQQRQGAALLASVFTPRGVVQGVDSSGKAMPIAQQAAPIGKNSLDIITQQNQKQQNALEAQNRKSQAKWDAAQQSKALTKQNSDFIATQLTAPTASNPMPAAPADQPVKDIAMGHYDASGTLPGPQKMVDLLGAALTMQDINPQSPVTGPPGQAAWTQYFKQVGLYKNPVPAPVDHDITLPSSTVSLMFKKNELPVAEAPFGHPRGYESPIDRPAVTAADAAFQKYVGDKPVDNSSYSARNIEWFMGLKGAQRKEVEKALIALGFKADSKSIMPYVSMVTQFVYGANVADAAWGATPAIKGDANHAMSATDIQGNGYNLDQLATAMGGRDTEDFKNFVYYTALPSRPAGVSESGFTLWFGHKYGIGAVPAKLQVAGFDAGGGMTFTGITEPIGDLAQAVYKFIETTVPMGDLVCAGLSGRKDQYWAAEHAIHNSNEAVKKNAYVGWFVSGTEGGVTGLVDASNKAAQAPISLVNRLIVARNFMNFMTTDKNWKPGDVVDIEQHLWNDSGVADPLGITNIIAHWNGWTSLAETAAKAWKESDGRKIWYETLSEAGVDPFKHETIAFWGQMAVDTGIGFAADKGLGALVKFGAGSQTMNDILSAFGVQSHAEILGAMKSASRIKELYNVSDEAAYALAATNDDVGVLALANKQHFGVKYFDPAFDFNARSIAKRLQMNVFQDGALAPAYRAFMSPLPSNVIDCAMDTDQQVVGVLRILGMPSDTIHRIGDAIINARLKAKNFPEQDVRAVLSHPETGIDAIVKDYLSTQSASKRYLRSAVAKATLSSGGTVTKYDEMVAFVKRYRGATSDEWDQQVHRLLYSPGTEMTKDEALLMVHDLAEGSLKIDTAAANRAKVAVRANEAKKSDLAKRIKANTLQLGDETLAPELRAGMEQQSKNLAREQAALDRESAIAVRELNIRGGTYASTPTAATEAQFNKSFTPTFRPTELAIFHGGHAMQEWSIVQKALHLDDVNAAMKRMWLSRMGTMLTIVGSDEALRATITGINPLGETKGLAKFPGFGGTLVGKYADDAAAFALGNPTIKQDIFGIVGLSKAHQWDIIGPFGDRPDIWDMGARQHIATFNAHKSFLVADWLDEYDTTINQLRRKAQLDSEGVTDAARAKVPKAGDAPKVKADGAAGVPFDKLDDPVSVPKAALTEDEMHFHAMAAADVATGRLLRTDDRYLEFMSIRDPNLESPLLKAHGLDTEAKVQAFEEDQLRRIHAWMSNEKTAQMLRTGKADARDFADVNVRATIGPVQYAMDLPGVGASKLVRAAVAPSDWTLGTLEKMGTHLKKQVFGHYFNERMIALEGVEGLGHAEKVAIAGKYALIKTDEMSYLSGKTLVEENLRNVVMFLPAYRQFMTWWAKRFITRPMSTSMLMKTLSSMPSARIPNNVPILGGNSWDPQSMNFFAGFNPDSGRSWLPPMAPTITIPFEAAALTGDPTALALYKKMNGGYEPGAPQMRWADSLIYGVTAMAGHPFTLFNVSESLGIPMPGTASIDHRRKKAVITDLVVQALQSDGRDVNVNTAVRRVGLHEASKGVQSWLVPGTTGITSPIITVQTKSGPMKLDLNIFAQAQYDYMQATSDQLRAKVLAKYPSYAPVATYWTKSGPDALQYLADNRWLIPLVSQRNASTTGWDNIAPATAAEFATMKVALSPQGVAAAMKKRYEQVDRFVLAKAYKEASDGWEKEFEAKGIDPATGQPWKGQAKKLYHDPKMGYKSAFLMPRQKAFYEEHNKHGEMDRLVTYGDGRKVSLDMTSQNPVGVYTKTPVNSYVYPAQLAIDAGLQLTKNGYDGMKRLEASGLLFGHTLVRNSPMYKQYTKMRKDEQRATTKKFMSCALTSFKSNVNPNEWAQLFGKTWTQAQSNAMLGFVSTIDAQRKVLDVMYHKGDFGTSAYKQKYYILQDYIATQKKKNPTLAPYIGATVPFLLSSGPNALDKPHFIDGGKNAVKEWEGFRGKIMAGNFTPRDLLDIKHKASPELLRNWDAAVTAWAWHFTLTAAEMGRKALKESNNPHGWYKGWTTDSSYGKIMQTWLKRALSHLTNQKTTLSDTFLSQWNKADKAGGGNLYYDLLDWSK